MAPRTVTATEFPNATTAMTCVPKDVQSVAPTVVLIAAQRIVQTCERNAARTNARTDGACRTCTATIGSTTVARTGSSTANGAVSSACTMTRAATVTGRLLLTTAVTSSTTLT